jgi:uridine kinase
MARWAPERSDTIHTVSEELLQNYPRGRVVVAIDGSDPAITSAFADDLAGDLRTGGRRVERASATERSNDPDAIRAELTAPFRKDRDTDAVLIVDGQSLLEAGLKGLWNFSVRLDSRIASSDRAEATAIVNVDDPEHPRRVFADSC